MTDEELLKKILVAGLAAEVSRSMTNEVQEECKKRASDGEDDVSYLTRFIESKKSKQA